MIRSNKAFVSCYVTISFILMFSQGNGAVSLRNEIGQFLLRKQRTSDAQQSGLCIRWIACSLWLNFCLICVLTHKNLYKRRPAAKHERRFAL